MKWQRKQKQKTHLTAQKSKPINIPTVEILKYTGLIGMLIGIGTVVTGTLVADKSFNKLATLSESSLFDKDTKNVVLIGMILTGILVPINAYHLNEFYTPGKFEAFTFFAIAAGFFSALTPILIATGLYREHLFIAGLYVLSTFVYQFLIVSYVNTFTEGLAGLMLGVAVIDVFLYLLGIVLFAKKGIVFELNFAIFTGLFMVLVNLLYL